MSASQDFSAGFIPLIVAYIGIMCYSFAGLVFAILGMIRASRYEEYRYPLTIHFLKP